jgi:hypothetical protein
MKPDTIGLVFEAKYLRLAKAAIKNVGALGAIRLARETNAWGVVLAGRLHKEKAGCFAAILQDEYFVEQCAVAAHTRMAEIGSKTTAWMINIDNKDFEKKVLAILNGEVAK